MLPKDTCETTSFTLLQACALLMQVRSIAMHIPCSSSNLAL